MREAEEVERFRSPLSACPSVSRRISADFDQTSFVLVQLPSELRKAIPEFFQASLGVALAFKADYKVIRVPNHDDFAGGSVLAPSLNPEVEDIIQGHVRKQW